MKVSGNRLHHRNNHLSKLEISTQTKEYSRNELDRADSSKSGKQSKGFTNSYVEAKQRDVVFPPLNKRDLSSYIKGERTIE